MRSARLAGLLLVLFALPAGSPAKGRLVWPPQDPGDYYKVLQEAGIDPSPPGIARWLRDQMKPPPAEAPAEAGDERIRALVSKLGHDDYAVREQASEALRRIGKGALPRLREAAGSADPEIGSRAQGLIDEIEGPAGLDKGQVHDAIAYALLQCEAAGGIDPDAALALADFWPRFKGSEPGKQWMITALGLAAVQPGPAPDAAKLRMVDRLISILESPVESGMAKQTALNYLVQATTENHGFNAAAWRRWHADHGGKPSEPLEEEIPEEGIVLDLGLKAAPRTPSIEVAGKDAASWEEATALLKAEAERKRKDGKTPFVLVRFLRSADPASFDALYASCKDAGLQMIRLRPVEKGAERKPASR